MVAPAENTVVDAGKSKTARAMLLGTLSEEVLLPVSTKPTAQEVWDSLKVRFVGADRVRAARLASLRGEFEHCGWRTSTTWTATQASLGP